MHGCHLPRFQLVDTVEEITAENHHMRIFRVSGKRKAEEIRIRHKAQLTAGGDLRIKSAPLMVTVTEEHTGILREALQQ